MRSPLVRFAAWTGMLLLAWTGVWLLHNALVAQPVDLLGDTLWWTAAKVVVWGGCGAWLARGVALGIGHVRRLWLGFVLAGAWVGVLAMVRALGGPSPTPHMDAGVLSACLIAPLFEELLFRGAALGRLRDEGVPFWPANLASAAAFALLHLPGWSFQHGLSGAVLAQLAQPFAFGLALGAIRWRRDTTLWATILVHAANNAWDQGALAWLLGHR